MRRCTKDHCPFRLLIRWQPCAIVNVHSRFLFRTKGGQRRSCTRAARPYEDGASVLLEKHVRELERLFDSVQAQAQDREDLLASVLRLDTVRQSHTDCAKGDVGEHRGRCGLRGGERVADPDDAGRSRMRALLGVRRLLAELDRRFLSGDHEGARRALEQVGVALDNIRLRPSAPRRREVR